MKLKLSLGFTDSNAAGGVLSFTSALPTGFIYTRNDNIATYRDAQGDLRLSGINVPRFDHTVAGRALGIRIEPARQNKCTNTNVNPIDTTNIALSGSGATLTVVEDSAQLATANLDKLCSNGAVFKLDNTGGGGTASATISGTTGTATAHSYSVWARGQGIGQSGDLRRDGAGTPKALIQPGGHYQRYKVEDEADSTTNKLRVTAKPGQTVYFILNQMEEGAYITSEIAISGAAATRQMDSVVLNDPNTLPYFNEEQGFMSVSFRISNKITAGASYLAVAHNGTSAETIGLRVADNNDVKGYVRSGSSSKHANSNNDEVPVDADRNLLHSAAVAWKSGEAFIASSGNKNLQTYSGDPSGITAINFGSRNGNNDPMTGHIMGVSLGNAYPSDLELGTHLARGFDKVIMTSGQSNMVGYFKSTATGSGAGRKAMLDAIYDAQNALDVLIVEGGRGGAALLKASDTTYFIDQSTGAFNGSGWNELETAINLSGRRGDLFIWDQGEADAADLDAVMEPSGATYKTQLLRLFDEIRSIIGNAPCMIIPIGWRAVFTNTGGLQLVREAQQTLASENAYIHQGAEKYDQNLTDGVHLDDAGYVAQGTRIGRKALDLLGFAASGVDGSVLSAATRSGTTVTATITHDAGTDFTVGTTGTGFHFFDNGSEITINSATRTSATTLSLTLASTPSGTEELFCIHDAETGLNTANILIDNASTPMVLRAGSVSVD